MIHYTIIGHRDSPDVILKFARSERKRQIVQNRLTKAERDLPLDHRPATRVIIRDTITREIGVPGIVRRNIPAMKGRVYIKRGNLMVREDSLDTVKTFLKVLGITESE